MKMPTIVYILYLLAEKSSCSAELSMKKFYNPGVWFFVIIEPIPGF